MEEYQIPAYHLSGTVKALKGGLEDIEMEDQEDPDEDGEHGSVEEHYPEEEDPKQPLEPEDAEVSIKQEVLNACKERAEEKYQGLKSAGMAQACQEMYEEYHQMYNAYGEEGDQEKAERAREKEDIALSLQKYYETQSKFEARENEEELTIESAYNTMYIKAPVIDENGKTSQDCSAQQYLTEAAEQEIEEAGLYTEGYLVEQKTTDSYIKSKPAQGQTFKERYKPKTSYQLEELRRYGL